LANTNSGQDYFYIAKLDTTLIVSIDDPKKSEDREIVIYPNPTKNDFHIIVPPKTTQVQILNSLGQIVQKIVINREIKMDFEIEKSGIYFIKIITDKQTLIKKLIIN